MDGGILPDLDRQIVAALAVNGRATWGQLGRAVDVSQSTAARRAQRLLDSGVVRVVGVPDPIACGFGQPVVVWLRCAPGTVRHVAGRLAERDDARFVAVLAGANDVIAELVATGREHLTRILVDELHQIEGVTGTSSETVLRTFTSRYDWSRELLGERAGELAAPAVQVPAGPVPLDSIDLALIRELGADGRRSYTELAGRLGVGDSMVARRVSALVARGCLSFATVVDPALLGYSVEAMVRLRVDPPRLEEAAASLCAQPAARYVSATTGGCDLLCEVVLPDAEALYLFITRTLAAMPGLRDVQTSVELQALKRAFRPRPPSGASYRDPRPRVPATSKGAVQ